MKVLMKHYASRTLFFNVMMAIFLLGVLPACSSTSNTGSASEDYDHDNRQFVPNNGAEVRILTPEDGAVVQSEAGIVITIETTNFTIGEDGNHWHIYYDGTPIMVIGGKAFVMQNLSPGEHEIEVYLSLGTHEDLENGDKISITVTE